MFKRIAVVVLLSLPFAAWAFIKPVRVLAPELAGVECDGRICTDDPARLKEAATLLDQAERYVRRNVGDMHGVPRAIFCSAAACSHAFGLESAAAYNFGTFAIVIGHKAWQPHFVRHELIHHLQSERLGSLDNWLLKPKWFREGMAYSLSGDPRRPLPQPLEGYRAEFETWYPGKAEVWTEAGRL
jgi:hypothetical protein